jgi:predicted nucleotidyltransferase
MGNIFHSDFREFIHSLNNNNVRYLLVGGYAVMFHGHARNTGDMDIWVDCTSENYALLEKAFREFGMPVFDMTEDRFLQKDKFDVFRFGRKPVAIDIMTKMANLDFMACYKKAERFEDDGLVLNVVHINNLITAKKAAGRGKDLEDLLHLSPSDE